MSQDNGSAGLKVWVRGIVQGVGFRPFIFNLAERLGLTGWVSNTSSGVEIEVNGPPEALQSFRRCHPQTPPAPLARIDELRAETCQPDGYTTFEILASQPQDRRISCPSRRMWPSAPDCRRELFDPADRRYRYPFINCTNCGPRFSIIHDIPYDRPNTTMAGFPLCPDCQAEYENPLDRRFHAQPVACPACGPQLWFESRPAKRLARTGRLRICRSRARLAKGGKILAIKGLGGFHLACDAANPAAVERAAPAQKTQR